MPGRSCPNFLCCPILFLISVPCLHSSFGTLKWPNYRHFCLLKLIKYLIFFLNQMCPGGAALIFSFCPNLFLISVPCLPFLLAQIDKYLNKENFKIQMCLGGAAQIKKKIVTSVPCLQPSFGTLKFKMPYFIHTLHIHSLL